MSTITTATTTMAVAGFAELRLTSNLAEKQIEEDMNTAAEIDFGGSDITDAAAESEQRFNGKTPPAASVGSSSSSAGDASSAAPGLRSASLHDGKRPKTLFGGKLVPAQVASKQARAVQVQFAAFGDTGNMGPDALATWADIALGGEESIFCRNIQWHLHVLKIAPKQGKNEGGEAVRKRLTEVRGFIVSLLFVGQNLGPLAPSGVAYLENGESVLRQINFAIDSIKLKEVTTLPVSADRVRCVLLTAFLNVSFLFLLITLLEEEEGRKEGC
jgi:hypothetical protein